MWKVEKETARLREKNSAFVWLVWSGISHSQRSMGITYEASVVYRFAWLFHMNSWIGVKPLNV